MQFHYYPMDSQNCSLDISLFSSRQREVALNWIHEKYHIALAIDESPLNYAIIPLPNTKTQLEYKEARIVVEFLHANYLFERSLSASLFNTYIPSFLVVCLSMISFWLDVEAVPGRVTLGVTAILTLSTQIVQARSSLPVLDYMTAMDVWLLGCLVMVFASLIEFTLANAFARKLKNSRINNITSENLNLFGNDAWMKSDSRKRLALNCRRSKSGVVKKTVVKKLASCNVSKDNLTDRISRICFPMVALGLGGFYWFYFYNKAYP